MNGEMDFYSQFVDKWRQHFPVEDPPLLDLHSCTSVVNEFETVNVGKLRYLHKQAKQTSDTLKAEWQKADFIEKFLAGLVSEHSHGSDSESLSDEGRTPGYVKKSPIPSPRFSMKDALSRCINSSVETFVNVGLGVDAIDVTDNHEIQINSLVEHVDDSDQVKSESESNPSILHHNTGDLTQKVCQSSQVNEADKQVQLDEVDTGTHVDVTAKIPVSQRWSLESQTTQEVKIIPNNVRKVSAPERSDSPRPFIKPRSFSRNVVRPKSRQSLQRPSDQVADKFFPSEGNELPHPPQGHINSIDNPQIRSFSNASLSSGPVNPHITTIDVNTNTSDGASDQLNTGRKPLNTTVSQNTDEPCGKKGGKIENDVNEGHNNMKRFRLSNSHLKGEGDESPVFTQSYRKICDDVIPEDGTSVHTAPTPDSEEKSEQSPPINRFSQSHSFHGVAKKKQLSPDISKSAKETLKCKTSSLPTNVKRTRVSDYENLSVDFLLRRQTDNLESSEESEEDDYVSLDELATKNNKKSVDSGVESVSTGSTGSGEVFPVPSDSCKEDTEDVYDNVVIKSDTASAPKGTSFVTVLIFIYNYSRERVHACITCSKSNE